MKKITANCTTGEVLLEDLSAEEIAEAEAITSAAAEQKAAEEAAAQRLADLKTSAKSKLIAGEPLTAEEADTLVI